MFEDSTFASASRIHTRSRRYAAGSLILQTALVAMLVLIPYIYPNALPPKFLTVALIAPPPAAVRPVVEPQHAIASSTHSEFVDNTLQAPGLIHRGIPAIVDHEPPGPISTDAFAGPGPGSFSLGPATPQPAQRVRPAQPSGPLHVSEGVAAGQLLLPIQPRYPAIAQQARIQGTVVVSAIIGTDGRIASLRVLSGPPILVQAALDAIRQARYRPLTLNGQPVEVETTINVVFTLAAN